MYDNISVEQSDKGLGCILKTSPDLSTVAVIANARQEDNVSLIATALRMDLVTKVSLGRELTASHNFKGKNLPVDLTRLCNLIKPPCTNTSADNENKHCIICF